MSRPIVEYIAADIEAAINAITEANGFNQDLTAARPKRVMFLEDSWEDRDVLVIQGDENDGVELVGSYGVREVVQEFALMAIVIDSDASDAAIDTRTNQVAADIKKKLRADPQRSTYALDTIIRPAVRFTVDAALSGITVNVDVKYRVKEDDPYTQAG